jgi:hypothetical protein
LCQVYETMRYDDMIYRNCTFPHTLLLLRWNREVVLILEMD